MSVVLPVWNGAKYLRESLDSILAQTYEPMEVLVMDDASTDETPEILAWYGARIRVHRQKANRGIYDNVNDGIALARGELIAVYHADDVYRPTIIEREADFLREHPETGAVFCLDTFIDAEGREYGRLELPSGVPGGRPLDFSTVWNALLTYKNSFFVCPTSMVRAAVYRQVGGYRGALYRDSADLDMWIRIARSFPVAVLPEHLMSYRHFHGGAAHRYQHLRTEPELHFAILDGYLEDGAREISRAPALRAHEAHRAEDRLFIAVARYIRGDLGEGRVALAQVHAATLARSSRVQRARLLLLLGILRVLCRLPRSRIVADAFYRRWHAGNEPKGEPPPMPGGTAVSGRS